MESDEFNTIMPMYAKMTEEDLRAIFDYLRALNPVRHQVENFAPRSALAETE